jgi:osmotically-inducible protein OsmY
MTRWKCTRVASAVLILSGMVSACAVERASSLEDARTTADVQSAIAQHPDLGPPNQIYVQSRDHVVYLSGLVDTGLATRTANDVARQVPGVSRVVSTVSVDQ